MSGDIQIQPGLNTAAANPTCTYPCGLREKNVQSNQAALCCDICDTWNHRKLVGAYSRHAAIRIPPFGQKC